MLQQIDESQAKENYWQKIPTTNSFMQKIIPLYKQEKVMPPRQMLWLFDETLFDEARPPRNVLQSWLMVVERSETEGNKMIDMCLSRAAVVAMQFWNWGKISKSEMTTFLDALAGAFLIPERFFLQAAIDFHGLSEEEVFNL